MCNSIQLQVPDWLQMVMGFGFSLFAFTATVAIVYMAVHIVKDLKS